MGVEVATSRAATVGRFTVRRALPRRGRRTVGAWCFVDHMGPASVTAESGLDVGPHPHCGLQTVTWLVEGEALHRDSLGSEQLIAPGQLNLMTAGHGVAHSEEATGAYAGALEGVQLWVALPEATRHGPARFEHVAGPPRAELRAGAATVLVGSLLGATSPASVDSALVGADLELAGPCEVGLDPGFEHAVVALRGTLVRRRRAGPPGPVGLPGAGRGVGRARAGRRGPRPAARRRALRRGGPHVVELRRAQPHRARGRARRLGRDTGRFGTVASALARLGAPEISWRAGALAGADPSL